MVFCTQRSASGNADIECRYVLAQLFGAYVACLVVYVQWKDLIVVCSFSFGFRFGEERTHPSQGRGNRPR